MGGPGEVCLADAARALLERPDDREALGELVGQLADERGPFIRGIRAAIRGEDLDNLRDEVFLTLVDRKLRDEKFLRKLVDADSAAAVAYQAASNFATDQLRGARGTRLQAERLAGRGGDAAESASDHGPHHDLDGASDWSDVNDDGQDSPHAGTSARFAQLDADDQLLCFLVHDVVPPPVVERLAARRKVQTAQVQRELDARTAVHDAETSRLRDELERRGEEIQRLQFRIASVKSERSLRGDPAVGGSVVPASGANEIVKRLQSTADRRRASSEELDVYELHLVGRVEALQQLQAVARRKLYDPEARSRRWDEVLALLGELPTEAADRRRAINRVTVRYRRLIAKLRGVAT